MMSPALIFVMLALLGFGFAMWFSSPTKAESDVQRHLKEIGGFYTVDVGATTILKRQSLSTVPWVDNLLRSLPGTGGLQTLIAQSGSDWAVGTLLWISLVIAIFSGWVGSFLLPNVLLALLAGLFSGFLPCGYLLWKKGARFSRFESQLPGGIDLMARALRSGHSVLSAVEVVSGEREEPLSSEFRIVFEEQNLGLPIREAINNLVERVPLDEVRFLATAILVQKEAGGNLAEVLDKASAVMRDRIRLKGQLRVYTAQGRITGWVLCLLPFIVFALIEVANPDYEKKLWTDPIGIRLVYGAAALMLIGVFSIRKITTIKD
jgi:tight adherence protein B